MNQSRQGPGEHKCFQTTEFLNWKPGKIVSLRIPAPGRGEWILMMCIYGVLFGLVGGALMYVCLQYFLGQGTMSYLEAFAVSAIPMSIVGALHLAGGDESIGGIEIDWAKGLLVSSSLSGTRDYRLSDLTALVLRGEYYFRLSSKGTSNERVYHARLDAQFPRGELLLLATDAREQHVEIAVEQLSPFAEELANALEVALRYDDEVEQRHKGFIRALLNAPTWLHALFAFLLIASTSWITWRVQPALSNKHADSQLRGAIDERGGRAFERDSWMIGGTNYGPIAGFSFEDQAITSDDIIPLRDVLLACGKFQMDLSGTHVTDDGLHAVEGNENLVSINLYGTRISDRAIESISNCPSLIEINLNRTKISDGAIPHLRRLPNLKCLRLWGTRVTDSCVPDLIELKGLREIYLNDTAVTPEGLAKLKAALPLAEVYD